MRLGVLASNNIYVEETTTRISDYCHIDAIILKSSDEKCNINCEDKINLRYIDKSLLSYLKLPFVLKKTSGFVDGFIVHYMNPYFALLIASGTIDKPIAYFCYGGDVRKSKIRNWLVRKALEKVDRIFVEVPSQKEYLHDTFGIPYDKLESSKIIFPVNPSFEKINPSQHQEIREKWNLFKKYIVFSPRTVEKHYNHHILLEGISYLSDKFKKDIQIVVTGFGNKDYLNKLIEFGRNNNLDVVNLEKFLTPQEMAEIFNISLINVNIPKHDQLGRSIIEACMCGSIPLLNINVPAYHDFLKANENCVFVQPEPKDIAKKVEWILEKYKLCSKMFYENNVKIFSKYQNHVQIYRDLVKSIEQIIVIKKER